MEIVAYGVLADEQPLLRDAFDREFGAAHELRCLGLFLNRDTAPIAAGHEVVLSGVNDTLDADVLRALAKGGTRMIAQRATGYNNIDLTAAEELGLTVARVSFYSPYSVAEFAWALALAVDRRVVRAAHRTREFDFRLDGLIGRDLHGRTAGVVGTGKIGTAFARIAHGFGVPEYAFGPRRRDGKAPQRDFAGRRPVADRGATTFEHTPHLALLSTPGDTPPTGCAPARRWNASCWRPPWPTWPRH